MKQLEEGGSQFLASEGIARSNIANLYLLNTVHCIIHRVRTPNEGINQRFLKILANMADKIFFGTTKKFGSGSQFLAVQ